MREMARKRFGIILMQNTRVQNMEDLRKIGDFDLSTHSHPL